jgi:flagella basal body P-ring formation protein FlgA
VTADTPEGQKKVAIRAVAKTFQERLVLTRAVSRGQVILDRDVAAKRELTDALVDDALADKNDVVGQQAAKAMQAGDVLTAGAVQPAPLVEAGDMVMVKLHLAGGTTVETVAKAMDGGSKGSTIRAQNEANKDVYDVVITGKLEGDCKTFAEPATAKLATDHILER